MGLATKLLALASILSGTAASAQDWWFVGVADSSPTRVAYFADAELPSAHEPYKRLWVERILESDGKYGEAKVKSLFIFDCDQQRASELQQFHFARTGKLVERPRDVPRWDFVPPESLLKTLMAFACDAKRPENGHIADQNRESVAQSRAFIIRQ